MVNWKRGGRCLRSHRIPVLDPDSGVVTSVALDADWLVAGLANHRIHIFSTHTGSLVRTLVGHELGVWAVDLVSRGGALDPTHPRSPPHNSHNSSSTTTNGGSFQEMVDGPALLLHNRAAAGAQVLDPQGLDHLLPPSMRAALALDARYPPTVPTYAQRSEAESARSDVAGATRGWGQPGALVVSGGCDKDVRVWDVQTGCVSLLLVLVADPNSFGWVVGSLTLYVLRGHTSTVRCLKVIHNRPIAVSGSRDGTLRVWDVQRGRMLRVLAGHAGSVRSLDVCGNQVVSGSYDGTCRVRTRSHKSINGSILMALIVGQLWDVDTGDCLQVFRGHFNQIYAVAFDGKIVASGGLDTTVRVWDAHTG